MPKLNPPELNVFGVRFISLKMVVERYGFNGQMVLYAFQDGLLPGRRISGSWYTAELWLAVWLGVPDSGPNPPGNPNAKEQRAKRRLLKDRALKHPRQPRKKLQLETKRKKAAAKKNTAKKQPSKPKPKRQKNDK